MSIRSAYTETRACLEHGHYTILDLTGCLIYIHYRHHCLTGYYEIKVVRYLALSDDNSLQWNSKQSRYLLIQSQCRDIKLTFDRMHNGKSSLAC